MVGKDPKSFRALWKDCRSQGVRVGTRSQGRCAFSTPLSFLLISDWLHSAGRLCPDGIGGVRRYHQLAPWLYHLIFSDTRRKRICSICISIPGWVLTACPWAMHLPFHPPLVRGRKSPWLGRTGSHGPSCAQEGPELASGRREMEESYGRQPQTAAITAHHWATLPKYLSLMFHFWCLCTVSLHLKEKDWL